MRLGLEDHYRKGHVRIILQREFSWGSAFMETTICRHLESSVKGN